VILLSRKITHCSQKAEPFLSTLQKKKIFFRLQIFPHAGSNFLPPEELPPYSKYDERGY
jgi:hypothetical protein